MELIKYAEKKIRQWEQIQAQTDSQTRDWHIRQAEIDRYNALLDRLSRKETGGEGA